MNNVLKISNLYKVYYTKLGCVEALNNVNLDVLENEIIGIIGNSGCGKSTLLSILAKLDKETNAKKLLEAYGLKDFMYKYPSNLSGGMKQRVALIRTLAINPDILLLDEPFSKLDLITRLNISDDVYKIIKKKRRLL